jgi:hypothetical protein
MVSNPLSGGNRRGIGAIRDYLSRNPGIHHMEAVTPAEVGAALEEFSRRNIDLLIVNGGDGTVQAVLTALFGRQSAPPPPLLALLRAGTTSMLARDVGIQTEPLAGLERIRAWSRATECDGNSILERPVLRVSQESTGEPLCGMFFGCGAIPLGIDICHGSMNPKKRRGELMPGLIIARFLLAVLTGNDRLVPATDMSIGIDHAPLRRAGSLFAMVSTLERLFLGLRPFWGSEVGPLHFTALDTNPPHLLRNIPFLLRGRRTATSTPENGYHSSDAGRIVLDFRGTFTLDGELFQARSPLTIEPAGPARFLRV